MGGVVILPRCICSSFSLSVLSVSRCAVSTRRRGRPTFPLLTDGDNHKDDDDDDDDAAGVVAKRGSAWDNDPEPEELLTLCLDITLSCRVLCFSDSRYDS